MLVTSACTRRCLRESSKSAENDNRQAPAKGKPSPSSNSVEKVQIFSLMLPTLAPLRWSDLTKK